VSEVFGCPVRLRRKLARQADYNADFQNSNSSLNGFPQKKFSLGEGGKNIVEKPEKRTYVRFSGI